MIFGDRIREIRISKRLSQPEVADMVGVAKSTYCSWENSKFYPSAKHFARIMEVLDLSASELVEPYVKVNGFKYPSQEQGEKKIEIEANAFKMLELLFEKYQNQHKIHENKIMKLEKDLEQVKKILEKHF